MMTGMVGSYRSEYLVNVLHLADNQTSLFNTLTSVIPFVLNFFIVMYIDGRKMGKGGKFRPLALLVAIPMGILLVLSFWAPAGLTGLWQVERKRDISTISAQERKELDLRYGKEFSFWYDIKIICKTLTAFVQKGES
jgi:hypothetical protein